MSLFDFHYHIIIIVWKTNKVTLIVLEALVHGFWIWP